MASAFDVDRKKLGLLGSQKSSTKSAFDADRVKLGLMQAPEEEKPALPTSLVLEDTLKSVMQPAPKTVDFKAEQAKKKGAATPAASPSIRITPQETVQSKLPAGQLLQTNEGIQQTLQGKGLPAASLVQQTGRGPDNASQIPGISEYETREKAIDETNEPEILKLPSRAMNYAAFGNPLGVMISRSLAGNSGATRRDSTGNEVVDKVTDAVNNLVTPLITHTGAANGQGIIGSTYTATSKALSGKLGQKVLGAAEKVIPGSRNVVKVAATEGIAGGLQGVGFGLQQGQDSGNEIGRNVALGVAAGGVLGGAGAALGEAFPALLNMFRKSGIADDEIAEIAPELLSLPEAQPRTIRKQLAGEIKTSSSTDPIVNPYTFKLDEASPQTQRAASNAAEGRTAVRDIDNQISELTNSYEQAVIDEYKVLKEQRDNPKGVNQGNLYFDTEGNVTGRQGRLSNNPRWYQEAMKENNYQKLSNKKLYELARKHVDEGFETEAGRAPSWRQENAYDEQLQALQQVRETLASSVKEIDSPIKLTDSPIKTQKLKDTRVNGKTISSGEPVIRSTELTREQQIMNKVNAKQPLTPEEIEFAMSSDFNDKNLFPESVPTESTYVKPKTEVAKVEPEAKTINKKIVTEQVEEAVQAVNEPRIRDRAYKYLDDAEKAARERIAKRRGQLNSNPIPEWTDYSIIMAAKLGKGTIKAANFAEELVKEFGEDLRPHADKILRLTREELRKQERTASKEGKAAADFNAQPIGDINTFSSKISRVKVAKSKPFAERWQRWRTQFSEDLAALDVTERKLNSGKLLDAKDSFYKAARLFRGAPQKAYQIVQDRLAPVMNMLEKSGHTPEQLEMYALAKHAQDVNGANYKSGFTDQEIQAVINELETPAMIAAQQELVQINRDMLQELVDAGVVSQELQDVLNERWKNYIPLFREMDSEKVSFEGGMSKALANVTSPIKALQGSEKQVIAPLENMVKNIFQSVNAAERNRVAQQIPKLAKLDTEEQFFRLMTSTEDVGQKNVLKVKEGGKEVRYEVHPEIYKAVMNLDQESSNTLLNILSKPASVLRAGATLTPEFALRNPLRDVVNAFVVSKSGFNPITDFGAGLIQTIKKGDLYKEWINNLGAYGNTLSMDRNVHKQALESVLKQPPSKQFVNIINGKTLMKALRFISDTTESATKVGEYRAALRSGASPQEAAYRSRDLMDFARAGSSIRPANRVIAFLNANIQGKSKLIRAIQDNPGGVITRGFVAVTAPTVGIYILNDVYGSEKQKETIKNAPDWMKDSFWLMAIPGTDVVARIPKPFDLAPLMANLPEKALEYAKTNDPAAFDEFAQRTIKENALPTQISGLLPIIEGMANYSFFKEGQIIPKVEVGTEWADQFDPVRTTTAGRLLAKGAEKVTGGKGAFKNFSSPRVMDNTIQGLTAGLGKYATDAIDVILDKTGAFKRTANPDKALEQKPLLRSFLVDPNQGGKAMDKFYTMKDELTKEKASAKLNGKLFSPEEEADEPKTMDDFTMDIEDKLYKVDESFTDLQGRPYTKKEQLDTVNDVSDAMSAINKAIKFIEKSNLSAAEKKRQIDPLVQQRNGLAKRATDFFKE